MSPYVHPCARCHRLSEGTEWVRWPQLLDEYAVSVGYVCANCVTEREHHRLAMLRELGDELTLLDFAEPDESPAWGTNR